MGQSGKGVDTLMKTMSKVNKIIGEIENNEGLQLKNADTKTVSQIVDIFLSNSKRIEEEQINLQGPNKEPHDYKFDIYEMERWKEQNNRSYNINYYHNIFSRRKFIGKFIVFFRRVIRRLLRFLIEPIITEQKDFNASVTASINALYNNEIVTQSFINKTNSDNRIDLIYRDCNNIKNKVAEIEEKGVNDITVLELIENTDDLKAKITELEKTLSDIHTYIKDMQSINEQELSETKGCIMNIQNELTDKQDLLVDKQTSLEMKINEVNSKMMYELNSLEMKFDNSELNFLRALKKNSSADDNVQCNKQENNSVTRAEEYKDSYSAIDYFKFENYFRGSRRTVKQAQNMYVEYFKNRNQILDLGCGRGEFLELMKENNINAVGIDAYEEFVEYCTINGFNAICADAISYVSNLVDNSVGGIFASQLIEHIDNSQLIQLCNDSYRKLLPGSYLVLETPNPTSLSIYTNAFYVDPSHNKPIHPKTLEYYLKQAGFNNIEIIYTEQSKVGYRLPLLDGEYVKNLKEFNDGINCITDVLFGSQDYAIIAQK